MTVDVHPLPRPLRGPLPGGRLAARLLRPDRAYRGAEGLVLRIDPADPFQRAMLLGRYDPILAAVIERWVPRGGDVLDCGGHIGYVALLLARAVGPDGAVHCFEPTRGSLRASASTPSSTDSRGCTGKRRGHRRHGPGARARADRSAGLGERRRRPLERSADGGRPRRRGRRPHGRARPRARVRQARRGGRRGRRAPRDGAHAAHARPAAARRVDPGAHPGQRRRRRPAARPPAPLGLRPARADASRGRLATRPGADPEDGDDVLFLKD